MTIANITSDRTFDPRPTLALLSRPEGKPPCGIKRATQDMAKMYDLVNYQWDSLDETFRRQLRMAASGWNPEPRGPFGFFQPFGWGVSAAVNFIFHRQETIDYFVMLYRLGESVKSRVSQDVWGEVEADADRVAAIERGRQEIAEGKGVLLFPKKP